MIDAKTLDHYQKLMQGRHDSEGLALVAEVRRLTDWLTSINNRWKAVDPGYGWPAAERSGPLAWAMASDAREALTGANAAPDAAVPAPDNPVECNACCWTDRVRCPRCGHEHGTKVQVSHPWRRGISAGAEPECAAGCGWSISDKRHHDYDFRAFHAKDDPPRYVPPPRRQLATIRLILPGGRAEWRVVESGDTLELTGPMGTPETEDQTEDSLALRVRARNLFGQLRDVLAKLERSI